MVCNFIAKRLQKVHRKWCEQLECGGAIFCYLFGYTSGPQLRITKYRSENGFLFGVSDVLRNISNSGARKLVGVAIAGQPPPKGGN
jgi:hypothetical protein